MEAPDFWDNAEVSQQKMKELKSMKDDMEIYHSLETQMEDMETMIEMGYEENDPEIIPEIQEMLDEFQKNFDSIRVKTLLSGEYDSENAIIKLNAGAGGTEACDWCGMLYRMYSRWVDRKGFTMEVLDYLDGDEAGVKSVTFQVNGENAYGYLKSERVYIVWYVFHRLMQPVNVRPHLCPAMLCRILKKIWMLRSMMMISVLIPIEAVVPVDSTSTRLLLRSVSHISLQESWYSVRMNVLSI